MSDIFHEVEEEVRKERLEKLWKKYGDYIIAGVSVVVLGIAGYKLWQSYEARQQLKASSEYLTAMKVSEAGQYDMAATAFNNIGKTAPSGYSDAAKLAQANSLMAAGKTTDAVALYDQLMKHSKAGLGDVARIRDAWAQADTMSRADLETLLAPVMTPKSAWRFMAREILAYRDFKDGRLAQSKSEYAALAKETDATSSLRQRAKAMDTLITTLISTGGNPDYGTVPPPTSPEAANAPAPAAAASKTPAKAPSKAPAKQGKSAQ